MKIRQNKTFWILFINKSKKPIKLLNNKNLKGFRKKNNYKKT